MADQKQNENDIIIKDQDGTYKVLRDGKFVPLEGAPTQASAAPAAPLPTSMPPVKPATPLSFKPLTTPQPIKPATAPIQPPKLTPTAPQAGGELRGFADAELQKQAESFVGKSGVTFASGEVRSRTIKAVIAHIKGVRKPFDTRETLTRSVQAGGAGLADDEARRVLTAAGVQTMAGDEGVQPIAKPQNPVSKPMRPIGGEIITPARISKPMLGVSPEQPYFPLTPTSQAAPFAQVTKPAPVLPVRPAVSDIARPLRSVGGPVDELGYDLVTWRRLAPNPLDRVKKIETQLDVLEQDGYAVRLQGVNAWRNSEVVTLYLAAGRKALEDSQSLAELLGQGGTDRLSFQEWQAVNEVNARLL
ncbi:MAG: hypothetical protein HY461_00570 [Parcubacteria group bacterium]|nr:hypothetical protein [Parcubacteria group bacterium]